MPQNKIKELRKSKKLTLDDMQDETGINRVTISQYERGKREPKIETWQKLADYFGVSVPYLMGIDEKADYYNKRAMANNTTKLLEFKKITPKELGEMFTPVVDEDTVNSWSSGKKYDADKYDIISEMLENDKRFKEYVSEQEAKEYTQYLEDFTKFYNNMLENKKFEQLDKISLVLDMIQKAYK